MSHTVTIRTEVRDEAAVRSACKRLNLAEPQRGMAKLYSSEATGLVVSLPGWTYPVVCQTESGTLAFDNFNGHWGERKELDRFLQAYAVEMAKIEARRAGHSVVEQSLADGSIKLTIQLGGTA